jgi:hypothetical protein
VRAATIACPKKKRKPYFQQVKRNERFGKAVQYGHISGNIGYWSSLVGQRSNTQCIASNQRRFTLAGIGISHTVSNQLSAVTVLADSVELENPVSSGISVPEYGTIQLVSSMEFKIGFSSSRR